MSVQLFQRIFVRLRLCLGVIPADAGIQIQTIARPAAANPSRERLLPGRAEAARRSSRRGSPIPQPGDFLCSCEESYQRNTPRGFRAWLKPNQEIRFQPRTLAARVLGAALTAPPCAGRAVGAFPRPDLLRRPFPAGLRARRNPRGPEEQEPMDVMSYSCARSAQHAPSERKKRECGIELVWFFDATWRPPSTGPSEDQAAKRAKPWRASLRSGTRMCRLRSPERGKRAGYRAAADSGGVLSFRPFSLDKQRKATRRAGAEPRYPKRLRRSRTRFLE